MKLKRAILEAMGRSDLQDVTARLGIYDGVDRRSPPSMLSRLAADSSVTEARLIGVLRKARVQEIAKILGVDSDGRKEELTRRILSARPANRRVSKPPAATLHSVHRLGDAKTLDVRALRSDAEGGGCVTVISAYYSLKTLRQLVRGRPARILLNGRSRGPKRDRQVEELRRWKGKNKSVEVKLAFYDSLFHTKLYLFEKGNAAVAWIGSANATENALGPQQNNEEILLRIDPAPDYLLNYAEKAWEDGVAVENVATSAASASLGANSLSHFFSDGALYYKPFFVLQLTVNPFYRLMDELRPEQRKRLTAFDPPDAEPTAGVSPFSIGRAYQRIEGVEEPQTRVVIRHFGVESCYGLWVASPYIGEVEQRVDKAAIEKDRYYKSLHDWLEDDRGREKLTTAFRAYLDSVRSTLDEAEIDWLSVIRRHKIDNPFESIRPLENRIELLKGSLLHDSSRITRAFVRADVPEFGEDEESREAFHSTLMESLAGELRSKKKSKAARWILEDVAGGVGQEDGPIETQVKEIQAKLEKRLRRSRA